MKKPFHRTPEIVSPEHNPALNPENEEHLQDYEGFDNPLDLQDWRDDYDDLLADKIEEINSDPTIKIRFTRKIESLARQEVYEDLETELISYILTDPYFDDVDPADFDAELEDALDSVWEWITMSEEKWAGSLDASGHEIGDGIYDKLSYEIYEGLNPVDFEDLDDDEQDLEIIDRIIEDNEELAEIQDDIDDIRDAFAKLTAKPWSIKARRNAKKALGLRRPISAHKLRKELESEWLELKKEFADAVRDTTNTMSNEELELDDTLTDKEFQASISAMIITWDIDDYTEFEQTKVETMKAKKFGKFNEIMHSGSKKKRALKYLALGSSMLGLGLLTAASGGAIGGILLGGLVAGKFGSGYAMWSGRKIGDVATMSTEDIHEYTKVMTTLENLDEDKFHDQYDDAAYDANRFGEETRKHERNARVKSVAFAAGMIALPGVLKWGLHIEPIQHGFNSTRHAIGKPLEWFNDHVLHGHANKLNASVKEHGVPTGRTDVIWNAPGTSGATSNVLNVPAVPAMTDPILKENIGNMVRLFNAPGHNPWMRAVNFYNGDAAGADNWLHMAVKKAGAHWVGSGKSAYIQLANGATNTDTVWKSLTESMLK
jgi:hypothetical protein